MPAPSTAASRHRCRAARCRRRSDRYTPTDGACGYEKLGRDLSDFDLVFAYTWPEEEDWLIEMVRRFARPDVILLGHFVDDGFVELDTSRPR